MPLRSLLCWDITQRWLVVSYRRLGTAFWSHLRGSSSPDRHLHPTDCLEASVSNYQTTLCNISEERRPHLHRSESLNSRTCVFVTQMCTNVPKMQQPLPHSRGQKSDMKHFYTEYRQTLKAGHKI